MKLIRSITLMGAVMSLIIGNLMQALEPMPARPIPTPPGMEKPWELKTFDEKKALIPETLRKYGFEKRRDVLKNVDLADTNDDIALLSVAKNLGRNIYTERMADNPKSIAVPLPGTSAITATESYLSNPTYQAIAFSVFQINEKENLAKLVDTAIKREKDHVQDYYVFYHGQKFEFRVLQDIIALLTDTLRLKRKVKHFVYLRGPEKNKYPTISAQNYVDSLYKTIGPGWHDLMASTQKILVSVNLSLFGNTTYRNKGMCSFNFFLYSSNIEAPPFEKLAGQFLKEHGFTTGLMAELVSLIKKYKTVEGNLLQIFVPKAKVDDCAYICYGKGIPCDNILDEACWDPVKKRHTRIRPILDRYCSNPHSLPNLDRLQARLVMTSSTFLNPDSGIKIFRYTTLSKEHKKQYKAELRAIIEKVA